MLRDADLNVVATGLKKVPFGYHGRSVSYTATEGNANAKKSSSGRVTVNNDGPSPKNPIYNAS